MARLFLSGNLPTDISGLTLWLKADSIGGLSDGDAITTWSDSSGNGYDATGSGGTPPAYKTNIINSLPIVRFSGSNGFQLASSGAAETSFDVANFTFFCVSKRTADGTIISKNTTALGQSGGRRKLQFSYGSSGFKYSSGADGAVIEVTTTVGNFQVYTAQGRSNNNNPLWANGVETDFSTVLANDSFNNARVEIGQAFSNGAERLQGDIAEIIFYARILSPEEVVAIQSYLANKYAISISGNTRASTSSRGAPSARVVVRDFGTCLNFSSGNRVQVKATKILSGETNLTICAWIKPSTSTQPTSGGTIYGERNSSSGNDILKFSYSDQTTPKALRFQYRDDAGTLNALYSNASGGGLIDPSVWHHVAVVKTGTGIEFYIDGVQVATGTLTASDTFTNTVASQIGNEARDGNSSFLGKIDDVIVYNTNLSSTQIANIYFNNQVPTTNGLGRWKFDEGSGTAATDSFGIQSDGTITSATYSTDPLTVVRTGA